MTNPDTTLRYVIGSTQIAVWRGDQHVKNVPIDVDTYRVILQDRKIPWWVEWKLA